MRTLLAVLIAAASLAAKAQGTFDALYPFALSSDAYFASNRTVGWTFQADGTMSVFQLGFFKAVLDAQQHPMTVGIWSSDGTLLTSTNVSETNTLLHGDTYYQDVPPVSLEGGQQYFIGAFYPDNFSVTLLYETNYTANPGINGLTINWAENTNGFGIPGQQVGNRIVPGGATFRYVVPEPAVTALLALSGFALLCWFRRPWE